MKKVFICDDDSYLNKISDKKINSFDRIICFKKNNISQNKYKSKKIKYPFHHYTEIKKRPEDEYFKIIKENIKNSELLNFSRICEFNFSDENIVNFYKIFYIDKKINKKNSKIFIGSKFLKKQYLKDLGFTNVSYINLKTILSIFILQIKKKIKLLYIILTNLCKELFFCLCFKKKKHNIVQDKIIYSHIKHHWNFLTHNKLEYAYLKNSKDYFFIVSALRNNSFSLFVEKKNKILNFMQQSKNFEILENYSIFSEILYSYFVSIKFFYKIKINNKFKYSNFFKDYINHYYLMDCTKQVSFKNILKNFFQLNDLKKICIPTFEFSEGRTVICEAKKKNLITFGLQHGFMGELHINRFNSLYLLNSSNKKFDPDFLLLMGDIYKDYLRKINRKISYSVIGNARIEHLPPKYKFNKNKKKKILILLDLHNWKGIINDLNNIYEKSHIYIKPHPYTQKIIDNYLKKMNWKINQYQKNSQKLDIFDCILCSDSGVAIEFAMTGWPVFIIKNNNFINYSPLALSNNQLINVELTSYEIKRILVILNNKNKINSYIKKLKYFSKLHCLEIGIDAENKFKKIF